MRIKTTKDHLVEALQRVKGATSIKMPILSHVLIEAKPEGAFVTATDTELVIRTQLKCTVEEPGSAAIPVDLLGIVKPLGGIELILKTDGARAIVTCEASRRSIYVMPAEDFPETSLKWATETEGISCDRGFSEAMHRVAYCVVGEGDPFSVPGVYLHGSDAGTNIVASDGHRLSRVVMPGVMGESWFLGDDGIVVPRRGVMQLMSLVNEAGKATLTRTKKALGVVTDLAALEIRLLPQEFPDYSKIIPEDRPYHVDFDRQELLARLKGLLPVVKGSDKFRALKMSFQGDTCQLSTGGDDRAAVDEMVLAPSDGAQDGFHVNLNIRYVMDAVASLTGDIVRMEWVDDLHGIIFCPVPGGVDRELHLIMPMVV